MTQFQGNELAQDDDRLIDKSVVFDIYGPELVSAERVLYPRVAEDFDILEDRIQALRGRAHDSAIVLVDGAFDVPHPNHDWYLRHCRLLGASLLLEKREEPLDDYSLREAVASKAVSLVVTVDADAKIQAKKGGLTEKGGISRPVYPWRLRADRIAGLTFDMDGRTTHVADLVTVEGDTGHVGTPLESSLTLARFMRRCGLLDGLVVYGEHRQTIIEACATGVPTMVIPHHTDYVFNPADNQPWTSSGIIRRAQGK